MGGARQKQFPFARRGLSPKLATNPTMMSRRCPLPLSFLALSTTLLVFVAGCPKDTGSQKSSSDTAVATKKPDPVPKKKPPAPTLRDQNGDTAFLAFVGRLRRAVAAHDAEAVAAMMTPDFGYLLEPTAEDTGEGRGVFAYWDRANVWPELQLVLNERFVPSGNSYMVAPPEFAAEAENYHGFRAGLQLVNGGWKFAYFVKG